MTRTILIIAKDADGNEASLTMSTDREWIAIRPTSVGAVAKDWNPTTLLHLSIQIDDKQFIFVPVAPTEKAPQE